MSQLSEQEIYSGDDPHSSTSTVTRNYSSLNPLENVGNWVKQSQEIHQKQHDANVLVVKGGKKRKRENSTNVMESIDCNSFDEDDPDGELDSVTSSCGSRSKPKLVKAKDEKLHLQCEWLDCQFKTSHLLDFVKHVSYHIPELEVRVNEKGKDVYACLWSACEFQTPETKEIIRHVNFHSFHTKVKCIGSNMMKRSNIPKCTYNPDGRNIFPDFPEEFACCWDDCDLKFNNSQLFFYHVHSHVMCNPRGKAVGGISCCWRGCKGVYRNVYKLAEHVRTHTQEKLVGCPYCGGLFASKTKFFDHCKRQVPIELQDYQCSHCSKYYASERLLRDHMRHHVNHYKCRFCDMTCPTPSSLSVHIRYRHLDSKPFKCGYCEFMAKTQYDMKQHLNTHIAEPLYHCNAEDCDYSCRSLYGISKHFRRVHEGNDEPLYCCHICDERFERGAKLTNHLFECHSFRWPSGHVRFRYKHDEDGYYRLQTIRYESLEVTQEMLRAELVPEPSTQRLQGGRYNLRQLRSRSQDSQVVFAVEEEKCDPGNNILITIEELDHSGNVVRSQVVETGEVHSVPDGNVTLYPGGSDDTLDYG
ncbi:histone H4 transcription factor isoform X2 [Anabrus simplex]|uniref:histone H4 transcription factor isoform X2 n=1 Tax=Anabrus simplex TaxID=316456 RepID=UPI0035A27CF5